MDTCCGDPVATIAPIEDSSIRILESETDGIHSPDVACTNCALWGKTGLGRTSCAPVTLSTMSRTEDQQIPWYGETEYRRISVYVRARNCQYIPSSICLVWSEWREKTMYTRSAL